MYVLSNNLKGDYFKMKKLLSLALAAAMALSIAACSVQNPNTPPASNSNPGTSAGSQNL